ncbi:MAG: hypothetical protein COV31_01650 [Candidatus Yanofskybacteria bacterium CG10_big_fil_rev_8_21_14_0_10_46_23]|uniref:Band 7 domain-containing protein n=1 Tax=Candidatus Yanofskybacteria bacterium CG10_big_fil_rev_8_21_14_0_10_46_23 TaxID=1975098 RepID=A0A2H0R4C7_9BACT|nr:MAG: hypothetical protein COV31_01650 [Candidatus Yanofskybacteria bacterium CG10_big_fil_rev_8_21_14_0_10_46_23]
MFLLIIEGVLLVFGIYWFLVSSLFRVRPHEFAYAIRRFILLPKSPYGDIAVGTQQGVGARLYMPGWHFVPFIKVSFFGEIVRQGFYNLDRWHHVVAHFGRPLNQGQLIGNNIPCNGFRDGEAFLRGGGQSGPQLNLIGPGQYAIHPTLFSLFPVQPLSIGVEQDAVREHPFTGEELVIGELPQFGVVTLSIGHEIPDEAGRIAGRIATGHNNFQNLPACLPGGWAYENYGQWLESGVQEEVLEPGTYNHNPVAVRAETRSCEFIFEGTYGVVISSAGREPEESERLYTTLPATAGQRDAGAWIINPDCPAYQNGERLRGILPDPFGPGIPPFSFQNSAVYNLVPVDGAPVRVCWGRYGGETPPIGERHLRFETVRAITKDGFDDFLVTIEAIVQADRTDAAKIVALAGSVEKLVRTVIVPVVDGGVREIIQSKSALYILKNSGKIKKAIEGKIKEVVGENDKYPINLLEFRIIEFPVQESRNESLKRLLAGITGVEVARQEVILQGSLQKVETARIETEKARAKANLQELLVRAGFQKEASADQAAAIAKRLAPLISEMPGGGDVLRSIMVLAADPEGSLGKISQILLARLAPQGRPLA